MPLLDSYVTIGIKKTCFTSRVRERLAEKNHKLNDSSEQGKISAQPHTIVKQGNLVLTTGLKT